MSEVSWLGGLRLKRGYSFLGQLGPCGALAVGQSRKDNAASLELLWSAKKGPERENYTRHDKRIFELCLHSA